VIVCGSSCPLRRWLRCFMARTPGPCFALPLHVLLLRERGRCGSLPLSPWLFTILAAWDALTWASLVAHFCSSAQTPILACTAPRRHQRCTIGAKALDEGLGLFDIRKAESETEPYNQLISSGMNCPSLYKSYPCVHPITSSGSSLLFKRFSSIVACHFRK
jgi:hypothetical protein